jgi:hypothetical protein
LGLTAISGVNLLAAFGVPVIFGLIAFPVLLAGTFVGFHKSFDYGIELYDQRQNLLLATAADFEASAPELRHKLTVEV